MFCKYQPEATISEVTQCLQSAIDDTAAAGGGTVRVGAGVWTITTLILRSGVRLHLEFGAVLKAALDLLLYPRIPSSVANKDQQPIHLLYAADCESIAITGPGAIDGQDTEFWTPCETEAEWPYGIFRFKKRGERPLPLIQFVRCRDVSVRDISIRRSPGWTLHFHECAGVRVWDVRIANHLLGPNTDGIGITDSSDVVIDGCDITTGDDAIIVKSTSSDKCCERVVVTNCIAETNCAAFGIGAEVAGTIRNITFANCIARASLRVLQIELWQAGTVENIIVHGISGKTFPTEGVQCERPIYIDIQQFNRTDTALGSVRNIQISSFIATTRGRILITAQDGAVIENLTLRDVHLQIPEIEDPAVVVPAARSMQLSNFNPETRAARAACVFDNVSGLKIENLTITWPELPSTPMHALCLRRTEIRALESAHLTGSHHGVGAISRL